MKLIGMKSIDSQVKITAQHGNGMSKKNNITKEKKNR